MLLCDDRLFWERHHERPPLRTSLTLAGGNWREVMLDDGRIAQEKQPSLNEMMNEPIERLRQTMATPSSFLQSLRASQ